MSNIKLNLEHTQIKEKEIMKYSKMVENIHNELHEISKDENEFVRVARTSNKL